MEKIDGLVAGLKSADRRIIAKAITLIESTCGKHTKLANELLTQIMPLTGKSMRIGISGIPGVGKSTFISEFGNKLIEQGYKVAVLAIDPSSPKSGGSIMGDKTRMQKLAHETNVFIRPSPSSGTLGGTARKTRESSLLLEAAGYNIILIETVGVGQSEVTVASMVDCFLMLQMPSTGDELQGIKKGILEMADIIAINKADGDLRIHAEKTAHTHRQTMSLVKNIGDWIPPVILCSSTEKSGFNEIWDSIQQFLNKQKSSSAFVDKRQRQNVDWFEKELSELIVERVLSDKKNKIQFDQLKSKVQKGEVPPSVAGRQLVDGWFS